MFQNRTEAGRLLAHKLELYARKEKILILAIPRGGVEVAAEIAHELHLPVDIIVIKKIGAPNNPELALGAVSVDDYYLNELAQRFPQKYIEEQIKLKQSQAREQLILLRGKKKLYSIKNKTIILVDDGVATGATMMMAVQILRKQKQRKIIIAIPVAPSDTVKALQKAAEEVICLEQPALFYALGEFYTNFEQVTDEEVKRMLLKSKG